MTVASALLNAGDRRVSPFGERRGASATLRNGRMLRVPCDDRRYSPSARVSDECDPECASIPVPLRVSVDDADESTFSSSAAAPRAWPPRRASAESGHARCSSTKVTRPGGQIWRASVSKPSPASRAGGTIAWRPAAAAVMSSTVGGRCLTIETRRVSRSARTARVGRSRIDSASRDSRDGCARAIPAVSRMDAAERAWNRRRAGAPQDRNVRSQANASSSPAPGPLLLAVAAARQRGGGARLVLWPSRRRASRVARFAASLWRVRRSLRVRRARCERRFAPHAVRDGNVDHRGATASRASRLRRSPTDETRERSRATSCVPRSGFVPNTELARLLGCAVRRGVCGG